MSHAVEDRKMLLIVSESSCDILCIRNFRGWFFFVSFFFFFMAGAEVYFSPNNNFPKLSLIPVFTVTAFQSV